MSSMENPQNKNGIDIALQGAYLILKPLPIITLSHNTFYPRLTLFEDHLRYRILTSSVIPYDQIDRIDLGFRALFFVISKRGGLSDFTGKVVHPERLRFMLRFFHDKGLPLTDRAKKLINTG